MKNAEPENTKEISGGFLVPLTDSHISAWQVESDRLDHDRHLHDFVASKLKKGDCMLDLGAFNGDSCFQPSRIVEMDGMIIAVEPGELAFQCLLHNVGLFQNKNVFPLRGAISEFCGESVTHNSTDNLGASTVAIIPREQLVTGNKYLMSVTIDYLADLAKRNVNFIKLDIEGFETKALIGGCHTLKNHKPQLLIEINSEALKNQGTNAGEIFQILMQFGYEWEIVQPECTAESLQYDVFCKPRVDGIALFQ